MMKKIIIIVLVVLMGFFIFIGLKNSENRNKIPQPTKRETDNMKIESSAFLNNGPIPSKYTCDGENVNPPLKITEVPENAKSLVLIVNDPDAPAGNWIHWTVVNINPQISEIAENSVPQGTIEGKTSFGKSGYGGPCPPSGRHRYFFTFYALDTTLDIDSSATADDIKQAMEGHILEQAQLMGTYQRN